jgi:hypothetical protein
VEIGKVMKHFCIGPDANNELYGYLPKMATTSRGSIGALMAVGFAERENSADNAVLTKGNSLLGEGEISKVAVLRMNLPFMKYMRLHHPEASQQHFNVTVLKPGDNDEEAEEETEEEGEVEEKDVEEKEEAGK